MNSRGSSLRASTLLALSLVPSLVLSGCGGRSLDGGEDEAADEVGDSEGGLQWSSPCAGPDAPTQPMEIVSGAMTPGPFARVQDRIYWANEWDPWGAAPVHVHWAPLDDPEDWHTVTETPTAVRAMVGNDEAAFWLEGDESAPSGAVWRVDVDGSLTILDEGLTEPRALRHRDGPEGGWLYYGSRDGSTPNAAHLLHRAWADGSGAEVLAETSVRVAAIDLSPTELWWVGDYGEVWRAPLDGGSPKLAFETETIAGAIEVIEPHVFVSAQVGLYRLTPGAEPYFVADHSGLRPMAATETHVYLSHQNVFEETHLGWIHRYPVLDGEYDIYDGEFVTDKFAPAPTTMGEDADALYWGAADEGSGQGGVWMLCKTP